MTDKDYKYVGEFKDNVQYGQGILTREDSKYIGEFKNNQMWGHGTLTEKDFKYVGEWKNGQICGQGTLTEKDLKYVGEFKDGDFHGQGLLETKDGYKYIGEFKGSVQHGQGTATNPDGSKYSGGWEDGKQCGKGTFTDTDGKVEEGVWEKESEEKESAEKKDGFDFMRHTKSRSFVEKVSDDVSKGSMWSTILLPELIIGRQTKNYILEKYKNRIREKAIEVAKEKLKYQKKKPSDIPEDQLKHWVMDAEKKIKSKDKWLLLKIILLPTGASFLPWL